MVSGPSVQTPLSRLFYFILVLMGDIMDESSGLKERSSGKAEDPRSSRRYMTANECPLSIIEVKQKCFHWRPNSY
uniref:Uncharacterized protein n=1 Tax=Acrobeloides nanus TaxID=290746 RepID=A0A914D4Z5_9BILA